MHAQDEECRGQRVSLFNPGEDGNAARELVVDEKSSMAAVDFQDEGGDEWWKAGCVENFFEPQMGYSVVGFLKIQQQWN